VHPAELQSFVATPAAPATPPRPREIAIGLLSAAAAVAATLLVLVAFGALGGHRRSAIPSPVVTVPNSPIDYAVAQRVADNAALSVVSVTTNQPSGPNGADALGSGVVLRRGQVLTSAHLLDNATTVRVTTRYGATFDAQVVGSDPTTDLCLLAVEDMAATLPELETARDARIGDPVVAVGAGRGNQGWVGQGVVQERNWLTTTGGVTLAGLLATSTKTEPATTGGALFDPNGGVIAILTSPPGATRDGLAVPIDVALDVADQLSRSGKATHGAIGVVFGGDRTEGSGGARVLAVVEGGPAATADPALQPDDVITRAGDVDINGMVDMVAEARRRSPSEPLEVRFERAGRSRTSVITLGTAAPSIDSGYGPPVG
jgi:S1-C subfamily serine protease